MNEYDIRHVLRIFAAHGMEDVLLTLEMHGKVATVRALGHKA